MLLWLLKIRERLREVSVVGLLAVLAGCVASPPPETYREPEVIPVTQTQSKLRDLPLPASPIPVAVYEFRDQTGQFKPKTNVQTLSRAVSQGGAAILIKALGDAGRGDWFTVLERHGLDNLLKERQIIQEMRARYLGESTINPQALPPLLFAGIIFEGGIVGFDTNTLTGGIGARFLGIGGDVEYRQNTVTVNLRAVSVKSGEILANVTTSKTLASISIQGGAFKFVSFDHLLEVEAGVTNNEPGVMALRRTVEKAVHSLIIEGAESGLWAFADPASAAELIREYRAEALLAPPRGERPRDRQRLRTRERFRSGRRRRDMSWRRTSARTRSTKGLCRHPFLSGGAAHPRARPSPRSDTDPIRAGVGMPRIFSGVATGRIEILTGQEASGRRYRSLRCQRRSNCNESWQWKGDPK